MIETNGLRRLRRNVVGLIPAGGQASRLAPLPCSKELYPVGFRHDDEQKGLRPKVVCHYLLERMRLADVETAYIILRQGKWDIPAYFGDGAALGMHLAYLMMNLPFGAPYTLDQAYPFVQDALIAFGFPDIIFQPNDAFSRLLRHQRQTGADIVLGLFPTDRPEKADMVDLDENGRIREIVIKPAESRLRFTWIIAVWTPVFTQFMHEHLAATLAGVKASRLTDSELAHSPELFVGDVIQAAINSGLVVESVLFSQGQYLDIGTPEDLARAIRRETIREKGRSYG